MPNFQSEDHLPVPPNIPLEVLCIGVGVADILLDQPRQWCPTFVVGAVHVGALGLDQSSQRRFATASDSIRDATARARPGYCPSAGPVDTGLVDPVVGEERRDSGRLAKSRRPWQWRPPCLVRQIEIDTLLLKENVEAFHRAGNGRPRLGRFPSNVPIVDVDT